MAEAGNFDARALINYLLLIVPERTAYRSIEKFTPAEFWAFNSSRNKQHWSPER
jgi:hypothetical protein